MASDPKLVELKAKYISIKAKILCFTTYCICCEFLGVIAGLMEFIIETANLTSLRVIRALKVFTGVILIDTIFILVVLIYLYKLVKKDGDVKKLKTCRIILSVIFVL